MAFLFVVYVPYTEEKEGEEDAGKLKLQEGDDADVKEVESSTPVKQETEDATEAATDTTQQVFDDSVGVVKASSKCVEAAAVNNITDDVDNEKPVCEGNNTDGGGTQKSEPAGDTKDDAGNQEPVKHVISVGKFTVEPASESDLKQSDEVLEGGTSVDPVNINVATDKSDTTNNDTTEDNEGDTEGRTVDKSGTGEEKTEITVDNVGATVEKTTDNEKATDVVTVAAENDLKTTGATAENKEDTNDKDGAADQVVGEKATDGAEEFPHFDEPLIPLVETTPLYKVVVQVLQEMNVENYDVHVVGHNLFWKISFVQEDSRRCENILVKLKSKGIGHISRTSLSIFPSSVHVDNADESTGVSPSDEENDITNIEAEKKENVFKKSIKSRLVVDQVLASLKTNAVFTFDYLLLLLLASMIACLGLVENSSVVLVASMLISPLMGPILAITFGQVVQRNELRNLGFRSELIGLSLCVLIGCLFGLITGGIGLHGAIWGSSDAWPTTEMRSRGMLRSLWVGVLIALPSGAGVAISVLGGNAGSLVGVAISASLLPPACNAGMLWAYAFLSAISPPLTVSSTIPAVTALAENVTIAAMYDTTGNLTNFTTGAPPSTPAPGVSDLYTFPDCAPLLNNNYVPVYSCNVAVDALLLGVVSLLLTLLNITCILIMGVIVLKIKEVAPHTAGTSSIDDFWQEDVKVARSYYTTTKGHSSITLGEQFLSEWKRLGHGDRHKNKEGEEEDDADSIGDPIDTLNAVSMITEVEQSASVRIVLAKLSPVSPTMPVVASLSNQYNNAAQRFNKIMALNPSVYLTQQPVKDRDLRFNTVHTDESQEKKVTLRELRSRFRKTGSLFIEPLAAEDSSLQLQEPRVNKLHKKRKNKVRFHVSKVEEEQELV